MYLRVFVSMVSVQVDVPMSVSAVRSSQATGGVTSSPGSALCKRLLIQLSQRLLIRVGDYRS